MSDTSFLLEASQKLAASLDIQETLNRVAELPVPKLADFCHVEVLLDVSYDGRRKAAHAAATPELAARTYQVMSGLGLDWSSPTGLTHVIRTGQSQFLPEVTPDILLAHGYDLERTVAFAPLHIQSALAVPLTARGRTIGALVLVSLKPDLHYNQSDLQTAEELGRRAALAIDNSQLFEKAQMATEARENLLAIVSHDLKNPLSAILLNAALFLKTTGADGSPRARAQALNIKHAAERMNRLIHDLLDLSSIEAGRLSLQPDKCDVQPLVGEVVELLEPLASEKGISLVAEVPQSCCVICDRERIAQVLSNLIGNAIKFSPNQSRVEISAEELGEAVRLSVKDQGPGIPADHMPQIFDRYWRPNNSGSPGSGLGLHIAKAIVEAHHEVLRVQSEVNQGSTFYFTLPIVAVDADRPEQDSGTRFDWANQVNAKAASAGKLRGKTKRS